MRGVTTNMPHVRSCIANPDFKAGHYDTSFIPKYYGGPGGRSLHLQLRLFLSCSHALCLLNSVAAYMCCMTIWTTPASFPSTTGAQVYVVAAWRLWPVCLGQNIKPAVQQLICAKWRSSAQRTEYVVQRAADADAVTAVVTWIP